MKKGHLLLVDDLLLDVGKLKHPTPVVNLCSEVKV